MAWVDLEIDAGALVALRFLQRVCCARKAYMGRRPIPRNCKVSKIAGKSIDFLNVKNYLMCFEHLFFVNKY